MFSHNEFYIILCLVCFIIVNLFSHLPMTLFILLVLQISAAAADDDDNDFFYGNKKGKITQMMIMMLLNEMEYTIYSMGV